MPRLASAAIQRELHEALTSRNSHIDGIDLDQIAGLGDAIVFGLADSMGACGAAATTTKAWWFLELARVLQAGGHATDHRDREVDTLVAKQDMEFVFAHRPVLLAETVDGLDLSEGPTGWRDPLGTTGVILQAPETVALVAVTPTVEGGTADGEVPAGAANGGPVLDMPMEPGEAPRGLGRESVLVLRLMGPGPGLGLVDVDVVAKGGFLVGREGTLIHAGSPCCGWVIAPHPTVTPRSCRESGVPLCATPDSIAVNCNASPRTNSLGRFSGARPRRFGRRGVAAVDQRQVVAAPEVGTDLHVQRIILQRRVELAQDGISLVREFGDPREHVFVGILIHEHVLA